jgi:hypothetical protein
MVRMVFQTIRPSLHQTPMDQAKAQTPLQMLNAKRELVELRIENIKRYDTTRKAIM